MDAPIYHLTTPAAWTEAQAAGHYAAPSLESEGFIHASTGAQLAATAERHYPGRGDLVVLAIAPERLNVPLRYEGDTALGAFPHLYGPLNLDAVTRVIAFPPGPDGRFTWPVGL